MRFALLTISLIFSATIIAQQGINSSLWYLNNIQHNVASVGAINRDFKAAASFRYQYFTATTNAYRSISASVESKVLRSKKKNHYLGIGGYFNNDVTGDTKYSVNDITIPIAYHLFFNDISSISIGVAPGLYERSIESKGYNWENQWTGYTFNNGIPGEVFVNPTKVDKFNLNAGLYFQRYVSATNKIFFGFGVNHILGQDVGLIIQDNLFRSFIAQFGMTYRFPLTRYGISPSVYSMFQWPNRNIIYGTNFDLYLQDASERTTFINPNRLSIGLYHRFGEGILLNILFEYEGALFGLAYDTNINSMIRHSKSVGGLEFTFSYEFIFNKKLKYLY